MKRQFFALLVCLSCMLTAQADEMENFFVGTVPVANRSQASFQTEVGGALLQVLVRASVQPAAVLNANTSLQQDITQAGKYAAEFSYQEDSQDATRLLMKVTFPEKSISTMLNKAGVQYWPVKRRGVLLLPIVNTAAGMRLITDSNVLNVLDQAGKRYGLPMQIANNIDNPAALLSVDNEYVQTLLMTYQKTVAVIVSVDESGGQSMHSTWKIIGDEQTPITRLLTTDYASLSEKGIAWVADQMAQKDAVVLTAGVQTAVMTITHVSNYESYEQVLAYLKQISVIDSVSISAVKKDQLVVNVTLKSAVAEFDKLLLIQRKMNVVVDEQGLKTYVWNLP